MIESILPNDMYEPNWPADGIPDIRMYRQCLHILLPALCEAVPFFCLLRRDNCLVLPELDEFGDTVQYIFNPTEPTERPVQATPELISCYFPDRVAPAA